MPFNLLRQLLQHVNLPLPRLAPLKPLHDLLRPLAALTTRRALATALMPVKGRKPRNGAHDIRALVHNDYGRRSQPGLAVFERVEIHELLVADSLRENGCRRAARDDGFEVVPSTANAAAVFLDEFLEGDAHLLFDGAGVVDVSRDAEQFGALVSLTAKGTEPACASAANRRRNCDSLHIRHR